MLGTSSAIANAPQREQTPNPKPLAKCGKGFSVQRLGVGRAEPFCGWASILHKNLRKTLSILPIAFIP
jgi:hypothetical protein